MARKSEKVPVRKKGEEEPGAGIQSAPGFGHFPMRMLRDDVNRLFEDFMHQWPFRPAGAGWRERGPGSVMAEALRLPAEPRTDISETEKAYEIAVEIPGMDAKDVDLSVSGDSIVLKGEKRSEREEKDKDWHLTERSYGAFRRAFTIPADADSAKASASFDKGVLHVTLPKSATAKSGQRKIDIRSK